MLLINHKVHFFIHNLKNNIEGSLLRLGCHFFSSWYFINSNCICTKGKVIKLDSIYAYHEGKSVEIARLTDVHIERNYLYCSLFFFSMNKIITVRHTMLKDAPVLWSISDNREFDEIMSIRLRNEVSKKDELLEFDL